MQTIAQKVALTIHLECAESAILRGDFIAAKMSLGLALQVANASSNDKLKSLIFRALNHVRTAQRRANVQTPQVVDLRPGEYAVVEVR